MSGAHAEYPPSSMHLTVACPGWRKQAAGIPEPADKEAANEGRAAHLVAEFAAHLGLATAQATFSTATEPADLVTEFLDGAAIWCQALESYPAKLETPVRVARVHPTKCWGTPDARQWAPETRTLRVAEYKYGHGFVDEFENWQLLCYAVGMVDELGLMEDSSIKIELTVVQPRFYSAPPIRTWSIGTQGLRHYAERMRAAVREAESEHPRIVSGPHCLHCLARTTCPTLAKTVMHAVDFTGRPEPLMARPDQVGRELRIVREFLKRLEARETGLAAMAESLIRSGVNVPHWSFERVEGKLEWIVDLATVEMAAHLNGKSALKPPALVTPLQAKQRKILDPRIVDEYSARAAGAMKLVPADTLSRRFTA